MNSQMYKDTHLDNLETIGLVPMGLPFLDYYINWITQHVVFWLADFYLGFFVKLKKKKTAAVFHWIVWSYVGF